MKMGGRGRGELRRARHAERGPIRRWDPVAMHYGRVTKACILVIALGPVILSCEPVDPLDVPLAADRTWVLGLVLHGPPSGGSSPPAGGAPYTSRSA